jgi:hypothetical protein
MGRRDRKLRGKEKKRQLLPSISTIYAIASPETTEEKITLSLALHVYSNPTLRSPESG